MANTFISLCRTESTEQLHMVVFSSFPITVKDGLVYYWVSQCSLSHN